MPEDPDKILAMNDADLQWWALSGMEGSYVHELGQTAMNMRCSLRMATASEKMAGANKDLVESTRNLVQQTGNLVQQTRNLVKATWGVVLITIITQVALIVLSRMK